MAEPAQQHYGFHELLVERFGVAVNALYTFAACVPAAAVSGLAAYVTKQPLLFPSLGLTAFLFFEQLTARIASPRNTLIGHAVAILAGFLSLADSGLLDNPSILIEGVTLMRVGASALSLALTGAVLFVLRASHPPSGATVLIVSLGLLKTPPELGVMRWGS